MPFACLKTSLYLRGWPASEYNYRVLPFRLIETINSSVRSRTNDLTRFCVGISNKVQRLNQLSANLIVFDYFRRLKWVLGSAHVKITSAKSSF